MNPHRPGWQTSEFWITLASQLLALLLILGWINPADKQTLEQNVAAAVTAIFTLVGSVAVVVRYIDARSSLKHAHLDLGAVPEDNRPSKPILPLILLAACGFAFATPAQAQAPARTYRLPWRQRMYNDLQEQKQLRQSQPTDPALAQVLAQIAAMQQQLLQVLQQRPVAPQPQIILMAPPYQSIPLGGPPRQDIPPGGPPRQDVPLGGPPKQPIPLGPPPRQNIPLGPPAPALPGAAKPGPLQPQRYSTQSVGTGIPTQSVGTRGVGPPAPALSGAAKPGPLQPQRYVPAILVPTLRVGTHCRDALRRTPLQ